jgi:hypothetical protein
MNEKHIFAAIGLMIVLILLEMALYFEGQNPYPGAITGLIMLMFIMLVAATRNRSTED